MARPRPAGNRGQIKKAAIETDVSASADFDSASEVEAKPAQTSTIETDYDKALKAARADDHIVVDFEGDLEKFEAQERAANEKLYVQEIEALSNWPLAERQGVTGQLIEAGVYTPSGSTAKAGAESPKAASTSAFFGDNERGGEYGKSRKTSQDRADIAERSKRLSRALDRGMKLDMND